MGPPPRSPGDGAGPHGSALGWRGLCSGRLSVSPGAAADDPPHSRPGSWGIASQDPNPEFRAASAGSFSTFGAKIRDPAAPRSMAARRLRAFPKLAPRETFYRMIRSQV